MSDHSKHAHHERLVTRMADTLGLDLRRELEGASLSYQQLEGAVARCMDCPDPEGCELWLEQRQDGATHTPGLCRNKALLENLRDYA